MQFRGGWFGCFLIRWIPVPLASSPISPLLIGIDTPLPPPEMVLQWAATCRIQSRSQRSLMKRGVFIFYKLIIGQGFLFCLRVVALYVCAFFFFFFFFFSLIQASEDSLHSDDPFEISAVFCVHWKCSDSFLRGVYMHTNYTPHDLSRTVLLWARLFFILDIAQKYAEPTWYSRTCNEMLHLWEKPWVHYFPQAQHIIYSSV